MPRFLALVLFCLSLLPLAALAQNYAPFVQSLAEINKIQPMQNPGYKHADDMVNWRVLDNKNKVVGSVNDMIVTKNGSVTSLAVEFDRLKLPGEVFIDYRELNTRPASSGYILGLADNQLENLYPNLLANIETAAGEAGEAFSARSLMGALVRSTDGRTFGKVQNILFGGGGQRAEALFIALDGGTLRGKTLAVPFGQVALQDNAGRTEVMLTKEQADAMLEFVTAR